VNCRDIVDRAARLSIKRLGQNVLLFGADERRERGRAVRRRRRRERETRD